MSDKIHYVKSGIALGRQIYPALKIAVLCVLAVFGGLSIPGAAAANQSCPGDADNDSRVVIAELVGAVRNTLDGCTSDPCAGDFDCDRTVTVSELIRAVNAALDGCGVDTGLVVDATWLRRHLGTQSVQVIDARVGAAGDGHIPGALPLSPYSLATEVDGIQAQIVAPEDGAATLSAIGLRPDAVAVVYGVPPEFDPARVVWALRYLGHGEVRYLDGGWAAWKAGGDDIAPGQAEPAVATLYEAGAVREELRVTGDWILEQLGDAPYENAAIQLVDARSPGEYRDGFIPTAVLRQWTGNLDDDGRFLPRESLEARYADLDPTQTTVVYCLAGWRASVAWLVLTELGFEDVRVYDGSWIEWGNPTLGFPIEQPPFGPFGVIAD